MTVAPISSVLNSPQCLLSGPDGNYWISSRQGNKITRFDKNTGARIDDVIQGLPLSVGPTQMQFEGTKLVVGNGGSDNIITYDVSGNSPGPGAVLVSAGSQGLKNPEFLMFADLGDPPIAQAGADLSVKGGEDFTLDARASSDPLGEPISVAWTQISGSPATTATPAGPAQPAVTQWRAPYLPTEMVFQLTMNAGGRVATDTVTVSVGAAVDNDNDQMPDRWEERNGLDPTSPAAASQDSDHDGQPDILEFQAGTNPLDGSDYFRILESLATPDGIQIRFSSVPGRHYAMQKSLDARYWISAIPHFDVVATGTETSLLFPASGEPRRFIRMKLLPEGY